MIARLQRCTGHIGNLRLLDPYIGRVSEGLRVELKLGQPYFRLSCSGAELELKLVFRPGSALQLRFSSAVRRFPTCRNLAVVLK